MEVNQGVLWVLGKFDNWYGNSNVVNWRRKIMEEDVSSESYVLRILIMRVREA